MKLTDIFKIMGFSMTCILSLVVVGFSITQLTRDLSDVEKSVYFSLFSSTVALWSPSPSGLLPNFENNTQAVAQNTNIVAANKPDLEEV